MKYLKIFVVGFILIFVNKCSAYAEERVIITSPDIVVNNNITDAISGMGVGAQMQHSVDNQQTWTDVEPFAVTKALTLPDFTEGEHCVYARFSDAAGNWTQPDANGENKKGCAWVDTTPPGGPITIEGLTVNVNVTIN